MTLIMALGQVPTSGFAEALNSPELVTTDQQAEAPAANNDAGADTEDVGSATVSAQAQQDASVGQNDANSNNGSASNAAARATAPTAASTTFSFHGNDTTKKDLYDFIYSNFSGSFTRSTFRLLDSTGQKTLASMDSKPTMTPLR